MASRSSNGPIPDVADYRAALRDAKLSETQRAWLLAHAGLPAASGSMRRIAEAAGHPHWETANLHYGRVARKVGEALNGAKFGWLGESQHMPWIAQLVEPDRQGEAVWRMRPTLVAAMEDEGWSIASPPIARRAGSAVWRLVAHHEEPARATEAMLAKGLVAIGWTDIGDLDARSPSGPKEIAGRIREAFPSLQNSGAGGASLWRFWAVVRPGDLVILGDRHARTHVMEVTGEYFYSASKHAILGYGHLRQATLTDIDPNELWAASGSDFAEGENKRWTFARCNSGGRGPLVFEEGARYDVIGTAYERNPQARTACLAHHGYKCFACGFDFGATYGELGEGFIHVHHRTALSERRRVYQVDPVLDLIPLCPNCHAMVHLRRPALEVETLRKLIRSRRKA